MFLLTISPSYRQRRLYFVLVKLKLHRAFFDSYCYQLEVNYHVFLQ